MKRSSASLIGHARSRRLFFLHAVATVFLRATATTRKKIQIVSIYSQLLGCLGLAACPVRLDTEKCLASFGWTLNGCKLACALRGRGELGRLRGQFECAG